MKQKMLFTFFFIIISISGYTQGCSDAGFCSAGSMKSGGEDENRDFTFSLPYAMGEQGTVIITIQPEVNWRWGEKNNLQLKLPYMLTTGNLGNTHGLSDPILLYSRTLKQNKWKWIANVGGRFAVNQSDKKNNNNESLPMPYQTSLGTYDLIAGLSVLSDNWQFAAGLQQPIIQNNQNSFIHSPASSDRQLSYFESYSLLRKGDIMIRAERILNWNKWHFAGGFLPIYHLGNDQHETSAGNLNIAGSKGLTLNMNVNLKYQIKEQSVFGFILATPLIVRDSRPDGLTRAFVASPYFIWNF